MPYNPGGPNLPPDGLIRYDQIVLNSKGGAIPVATADATGLIYTLTGVKGSSEGKLYAAGTLVGTATASTGGVLTWNLATKPVGIITYDAVFVGSGGTAAAPTVPSIINMSGAQGRSSITDAGYFVSLMGIPMATDANYVTALKASSASKTVPFPQTNLITPGNIGYVILRIPATTANTPPIFIDWAGAAGQPSAASPMLPTVWVNTDLTNPISPTAAGFVQDTAFQCFRPNAATDNAYVGRGQRYFIDTVGPARDIMIKFDLTNAAITQSVTPVVCCSSGEWAWVGGMSIIRNQYTSISAYNANRAAVIAANPGADPFFFVSARSGANQQAILDEQVNPVMASSTLMKFIRAIYMNPWINDLAFSGVRPYTTSLQVDRDAIAARSTSILSKLSSLGKTLVVSDCTYGNYTATAPVNGDLKSDNGNYLFIKNILGPIHKAQVPICWDTAYDVPIVMQSAAMANTYETAMADEVHPNGTGYTPQFKTTETPNFKLMYGNAPGVNTLQSIVAGLGSSTTTAKKARAQAVFDMVVGQYPTTSQAANDNRTTLRSQLDLITAA